jgi:hypothetical protein
MLTRRRFTVGMYSALMLEIEKGLDTLKNEARQVVEITRSGKIVSQPFFLSEKKTAEVPSDK